MACEALVSERRLLNVSEPIQLSCLAGWHHSEAIAVRVAAQQLLFSELLSGSMSNEVHTGQLKCFQKAASVWKMAGGTRDWKDLHFTMHLHARA